MKVPTYNAATTREIAAPVTQQSGAPAAAFGAPIAQGLGHVAEVFDRIQEDADNLREQDASNLLREKKLDLTLNQKDGYANVKGRDVLTPREGGKSLSADYLDRFRAITREIEGGLANDRQRLKFRQRAAESELDFRAGLQRHENAEIASYGRSVTKSSIDLAAQEAARQWDVPAPQGTDPATGQPYLSPVAKSIKDVTEVIRAQGMREGLPAVTQDALIADAVSGIHASVLAQAVSNKDMAFAQKYMNDNSKDMKLDDMLKFKGTIENENIKESALKSSEQVFNEGVRRVLPAGLAALDAYLVKAESGGRRFGSDGNILEGPMTKFGTAKGERQVLDSTNKDPGLGVMPARDDSPEERARVGKDYLVALYKKYAGDEQKTLAAYNWGFGNLDKLIAKEGDNWINKLPAETAKYVAGYQGAGKVGASAPTVTLEELQNDWRAKNPNARPEEAKIAMADLAYRHSVREQSIRQRESDAYDKAADLILTGTRYEDLPPMLLADVPGAKKSTLLSLSTQRQNASDKAETPDAVEAYWRIKSDPVALARKTIGEIVDLQPKIGRVRVEQLLADRQALLQKPEKQTEAKIDADDFKYITQKFKLDPKKDAADLVELKSKLEGYIDAAQRGGKLLSRDEKKQMLKEMLVEVDYRAKGRIWGESTDSNRVYKIKNPDNIIVPDADKKRISGLLAANNLPDNDVNIRTYYIREKANGR